MPRATSRLIAAAGCLMLATSALAQDLAPLENLAACRLDAARVALEFSYWGGACEELQEARTDIVEGDLATVSVPTINTAEVCTMQAVEIEFSGVVEAAEAITRLDVMVLNPDGEVKAGGTTEVAANSAECAEPAAKAD